MEKNGWRLTSSLYLSFAYALREMSVNSSAGELTIFPPQSGNFEIGFNLQSCQKTRMFYLKDTTRPLFLLARLLTSSIFWREARAISFGKAGTLLTNVEWQNGITKTNRRRTSGNDRSFKAGRDSAPLRAPGRDESSNIPRCCRINCFVIFLQFSGQWSQRRVNSTTGLCKWPKWSVT